MKQKLYIFLFLIVVAAVLVGLNAASYTPKEKAPDGEFDPNRSTFNAGATGTQAFYTLLSETGRMVVRWQEPPTALFTAKTNSPSVFVITGNLKREFTDPEVEGLLRWVSTGGRLVLIDREPPDRLLTTTANWKISLTESQTPDISLVDVTDQKQMTAGIVAVKPVQPTVYSQGVNAIQPSRFSSFIQFERFVDVQPNEPRKEELPPPPKAIDAENQSNRSGRSAAPPITKPDRDGLFQMPTPTPIQRLQLTNTVETPSQIAPVVHFAAGDKNFVVDMPFGEGKIALLSDPYVVSNSGISLVDNAQLALNLVSAGDGVIAFDEYHQGYGKDSNRFLQFFAGTPIVSMFLQAAMLIGLVFFSQSRRFARPVPEREPDRLSKLEYVAAMAEIQSRTKAYDLAIENIYNEFRRRVARYFGLDNLTAKSNDIAARIAERSDMDCGQVETTMHNCEEIIRGAATNKREVVRLAGELRAIEQTLGMTRARRTKV